MEIVHTWTVDKEGNHCLRTHVPALVITGKLDKSLEGAALVEAADVIEMQTQQAALNVLYPLKHKQLEPELGALAELIYLAYSQSPLKLKTDSMCVANRLLNAIRQVAYAVPEVEVKRK